MASLQDPCPRNNGRHEIYHNAGPGGKRDHRDGWQCCQSCGANGPTDHSRLRRLCEEKAPGEPLVFFEGYDRAIVGVMEVDDHSRVVYSRGRILEQLRADGMTADEADEFYEFNIAGLFFGPHSPLLLDSCHP